MLQRIGGRPTAKFLDYFGQTGKSNLPFPLNHNRLTFCFSARYALFKGIEALGLKCGDRVLLPSYNCGVEIEPFHYSGIQTDFYRIDKNLRPDLDDVRKRLRGNVKALLVTHFLGFPQPIEEIRHLCSEVGVYLIEDCAHALLSSFLGKPLGVYGDIAVFSMLKTLPVPNGGVLVLNNEGLRCESEPVPPSWFSAAYYIADLYRQMTLPRNPVVAGIESNISLLVFKGMNLAKLGIAAAKKVSNRGEGCLVRPDSFDFKGLLTGWGMSGASERLIFATDFEQVKMRRRDNFTRYLAYFMSECPADITLPYTELPEGVCPLFFPLIFVKEGTREHVYDRMKARGITTHPWWDWFHPAVPWDEYPDAAFLKRHLFGLPIHQDLNSEMIDRVLVEFADSL